MVAPVLKSRKALDTSVRHASSASTATAQTNFINGTEEKNSQCRFKLGRAMALSKKNSSS
jgi:hypothetical protein